MQGKLTQRKEGGDEEAQKQEDEADEELGSFADGGEEWTASSSLPDLMQRGIHVLGFVERGGNRKLVEVVIDSSDGRE